MKLCEPKNSNYAGSVIKLKNIIKLENCDNIVATTIMGFQAIVGKDYKVGDIGIVFPAECQLSEEFCKESNLFRHKEFNKNTEVAGYIEDSRRVKAVKFRGNRSDCLFMPLSCIEYTGVKIKDLKEGDIFDEISGHEICKKYEIRVHDPKTNSQRRPKLFNRVDTKYIPEHFDTDNYFRVSDQIPDDADIIVTQKLHGSSIRIAHTIVARKLNLIEHVLKALKVKIQPSEFDYVYGSRKVIKDINNKEHQHFYKYDIWTDAGKKLEGLIPENFLVYGELIGWTKDGKALQANYTYDVPVGDCHLYVYRVAFVNQAGLVVDLSWDQVVEFCKQRDLKYVKELWRGKKKEFKPEIYMDIDFNANGANVVPLCKESPCDEGVCIRIDGLRPYIAKAKSPKFYEHETKLLDQKVEDIESSQGEV